MARVEAKEVAILGVGLGLLALGLALALRKPPLTKGPGATFGAKISFRHRGGPQRLWVGFGLAPEGKFIGKVRIGPPIVDFSYTPFEVGSDEEWEPYEVDHKRVLPALPSGKYDVWAFLQEEGGELRPDATGFILGRWYPAILTIT